MSASLTRVWYVSPPTHMFVSYVCRLPHVCVTLLTCACSCVSPHSYVCFICASRYWHVRVQMCVTSLTCILYTCVTLLTCAFSCVSPHSYVCFICVSLYWHMRVHSDVCHLTHMYTLYVCQLTHTCVFMCVASLICISYMCVTSWARGLSIWRIHMSEATHVWKHTCQLSDTRMKHSYVCFVVCHL